MAYQFTKDLETGNTLIDSEHKQLFQAINDLLDACAQGKGRGQLEQTTKFLYDYTSKHFSDEEKLQVQCKYPEYAQHRQYHESFKKVVADLGKQLSIEGPTVNLVGQINTALAGWLLSHIKREDKKLAEYIHAHS